MSEASNCCPICKNAYNLTNHRKLTDAICQHEKCSTCATHEAYKCKQCNINQHPPANGHNINDNQQQTAYPSTSTPVAIATSPSNKISEDFTLLEERPSCLRNFNYINAYTCNIEKYKNDIYFQCTRCNSKKFKTKTSIVDHSACFKGARGNIKCPNCLEIFPTRPKLTKHNNRVHLNQIPKSFQCMICTKPFESKSKLDRHKKVHSKNINMNVQNFLEPTTTSTSVTSASNASLVQQQLISVSDALLTRQQAVEQPIAVVLMDNAELLSAGPVDVIINYTNITYSSGGTEIETILPIQNDTDGNEMN